MDKTITINTLTSWDALKSISAFWQEHQHHPNSDADLYQLICQQRPEVICPCVFAVHRDQVTCALLVARIERSSFTPAIGYFRPFKIPAIVARLLHEGLIGEDNDEIAESLALHIDSYLRSSQVDAVVLHHFKEDSAFLTAVLARHKLTLPTWSIHRSMTIGQNPGFLLSAMKSKHRSWIRKKERDLQSDHNDQVTWHWLKQADNDLCANMEAVAALTYQRSLGAGFVNDEEHQKRFALFSRRGQLRIQTLAINGTIKAFWIGIIYRKVFHSWATCYEPNLAHYEPGMLLFIKLTDELAREGVAKLDFGLGDAHYKQRFGDHSWREATLSLYAPTLKGRTLRIVMGFTGCIDRIGRMIAEKTNAMDRIKTAWRRRIQK
jgi:Acetyltransferase (GNAT) domain